MVDSPSDEAPAKAPRWDLADRGGYGGGNCVSWCSWMFSGSVGIYRRKKYVGGRPRGPRDRGACWKYALEAIIKLLFISSYHDKCLLFMLELY